MSTVLEQGGGLEKYLIETSRGMSQLPNIEADVITMDDNFTMKIASLLKFYYFKKIDKNSILKEKISSILSKLGKAKYIKCKNFKELVEVFSRYDVIYSKNEILEAFIFKFFLKYKNVPTIIFGVHTPHFYPIVDSIHARLHNLLYRSKLYSFLVSGVKYFHVSNLQSQEILLEQFPKKRVFKISYLFNVDNFTKMANIYHTESLDRSKFNVLWLARLTEQKGVSDLVEIINDLNTNSYNNCVVWNIAGDGDERNKIESIEMKWGNIRYFGHVRNDFVPSLLSQIDLFISTSKWEVSPFNIIEAQAIGKPVLAYRIAGVVDIIEEGKTGIIVSNRKEFKDRLEEIINGHFKFNQEEIKEKLKEKFNSKKIFIELEEMFLSVIRENKHD